MYDLYTIKPICDSLNPIFLIVPFFPYKTRPCNKKFI